MECMLPPQTSFPSRIATEIWHICWSFCSTKELRQLSLVCREISAPHIDSKNWMIGARSIQKLIHRLLRLANSPHAASVRSWSWDADFDFDLERIAEEFPRITNIAVIKERWGRLEQVFTSSLGAYPRLTTLTMSSLRIDSEIRATLASLPLLDSLELSDCNMLARTGPLLSLHQFHLSTGEDRFDHGDSEALPTLEIVSSEHLKTLYVDSSHDGLSTLLHLSRFGLRRLVDLEFENRVDSRSDNVAEILLRCLETLPSLESIWFENFQGMAPIALPRRLSDRSFPSLKSFCGPLILADMFTRGRPVTEISLTAGDLPDSEVVSFVQTLSTTAPLRKLDVRSTILRKNVKELLTAICAPFKELRILTLNDEEDENTSLPNESSSAMDQVDDRVVELCDEDDSMCNDPEYLNDPEFEEEEHVSTEPSSYNSATQLADLSDSEASLEDLSESHSPIVELPGYIDRAKRFLLY
ncbi:hypothetical protein R3P38DRAFT_2865800 [Favolaschia claudopus]|uniref:F-box domain-containing protein n=1 Tax=Favolaschia claudopus TaxID=2862362 RepID=A0AAW0DIH1_9AGAR